MASVLSEYSFLLLLICITSNSCFDSHYNTVGSRQAAVVRESRASVHKIYVWLFRKLILNSVFRTILASPGPLLSTHRNQDGSGSAVQALLEVDWELCESLRVFDSNICPAGCHEGAMWPHTLWYACSYFLVQPTWKTNTEIALGTPAPWLLWRYLALVFMFSWNQCKNF